MISVISVPGYGWCVAYLPETNMGHWLIDSCKDGEDKQLPEGCEGAVPAFYECYKTACDRAEFLRSKGFEARVLVLAYMDGDDRIKPVID